MGGAAGLVYNARGKVAWDRIWGKFCDLALAGGPPHRGATLAAALAALDNPATYRRVTDELERGLGLVTGWPVHPAAAPGWVGLDCPDAETAAWFAQAIRAENVTARREGATLLLPAGPAFRLEHEIKTVVTAVAKTHHYWTAHVAVWA